MEKGFLARLEEVVDRYFAERRASRGVTPIREQVSSSRNAWARIVRLSVPNLGTLIVVAALLMTDKVGALSLLTPTAAAVSTSTLAYQGRLANSSGQPLTQTVNMIFRLYNAASGGTPLWTEQWTGASSVQVSDGLFNVMLGSLTPIPQVVLTGNSNLFLGITIGTDSEMTPRVQLGSVPFAVQALTVPDGSITTAKLADGAVTPTKLNAKVPKLLGHKECTTCPNLSESFTTILMAPMKGETLNDIIEFTATTTGGPIVVYITGRYAYISPVYIWCGIQILQGASIIRDTQIEGLATATTSLNHMGCSGQYLYPDLPAGTYTFRLTGLVSTPNSSVVWLGVRQIFAIEY